MVNEPLPWWYKVDGHGRAITFCIVCIRHTTDYVLQASTIVNGNAVCYRHIPEE